MRIRVFDPLEPNHPLVTDAKVCAICDEPFLAGQRVVLAPVRYPAYPEKVAAVPVHATCGLKGHRTQVGILERIKDGDGSPYPVVTDRGQFTLEEAGLQ